MRKLLARYLPNGPLPHTSAKSTPHSKTLEREVLLALDGSPASEPDFPDLVRDYQSKLGSLLYLATSTRSDLGFVVPYLCRAMARPTPALLAAVDHIRLGLLLLSPHLVRSG